MDVTINEHRISLPAEITTWGDLLFWFETDHLKSGECITHVLLGGEETLNYRDAFICDQDLTAVGKIEIKSGDFDTVIHESLTELKGELKTSLASATEILRFFEAGNEEAAYAHLPAWIDSLHTLHVIFSEDLGWAEIPDAEISREECGVALECALRQLMAAYKYRHWVPICDGIEYD